MARLQDITLLITDGKHGDCQNQAGSGYYFVSCKDVRDGWIDYSGARQITEVDYIDTHQRTRLAASDIVITNSGTIGRMALVRDLPETLRTTFQKSVAIVKPDQDKAVPQWLYYALLANRDVLIAWAGGTAQKNLLLRDMRAFEIDVPPVSAQRKIAAILSAYDDLIENNLRRINILEEMAQNLYREWFVKLRFPGHQHARLTDSALEPIPEGWKLAPLGDLASQIRDSVNPESVGRDTPYFGLEHLPRRSITLSEWGHASEVQSTKLMFKKGDILFGKIRPYFHKVGVAPLVGVCSSDAIVIRPKAAEWFGLVATCTSSAEFVEHATTTSQGTKMPRANWDVLEKHLIPIPPEPILGQFNAFIGGIVTQLHNMLFRSRNLRRTRDLLLPKLISGELDVSELEIAVPEDTA